MGHKQAADALSKLTKIYTQYTTHTEKPRSVLYAHAHKYECREQWRREDRTSRESIPPFAGTTYGLFLLPRRLNKCFISKESSVFSNQNVSK